MDRQKLALISNEQVAQLNSIGLEWKLWTHRTKSLIASAYFNGNAYTVQFQLVLR